MRRFRLSNVFRGSKRPYEKLRSRPPTGSDQSPTDVEATLFPAIESGNFEYVNDVLESTTLEDLPVAVLNQLITQPGHRHHQAVARALQLVGDYSSVAHICQAIDMGLDHLEYTASEPGVIGKWYSWALVGIGTDDAVAAIRRYAESSDSAFADAMKYRLTHLDRCMESSRRRRADRRA